MRKSGRTLPSYFDASVGSSLRPYAWQLRRFKEQLSTSAALLLLTRRAQLCLAAPDAALLGSLDEFADGLFAAQLNGALVRFNACTIEQRRRYAVRWNRLLADRFFTALSEALEDVYATIRQGRIGQGS